MNGRRAKHCAVGRAFDAELARLNWQQQDLAYVLGCSVSYVSAVITGRKRIAADAAVQLGAAMALDPYNLLCWQNAEVCALIQSDTEEMRAIRKRSLELTLAKARGFHPCVDEGPPVGNEWPA